VFSQENINVFLKATFAKIGKRKMHMGAGHSYLDPINQKTSNSFKQLLELSSTPFSCFI